LRGEAVVYTAHFDHLGIGPPDATGDSIYNGFSDNAAGVAMLLAIGEALARDPPKRSVLFLFVTGEELGLLGSAYFVENPTVPIESIVANINLDMVGRNHPDSLVIIGEDFSTLGPLSRRIAAAHPDLRLTLAPDPDPSEMVFFRSDHFSFARKGIPAIFFTTWLHADYHQPTDRVEKIDQEKVARIARFVYHLTHAISADRRPPEWTPEGRATMSAIGQ
jgi:Zn-dependent M28 family amino/carboxypeptidase